MEHCNLEEIVAKCSILNQHTTAEEIRESYDGTLYESATLSLLLNDDYMV